MLALNSKQGWNCVWLLLLAIIIILYGTCVDFGTFMTSDASTAAGFKYENAASTTNLYNYYGMWTDIHVMIFVGFGFLMVFLKTHCWSSIGFNWLVGALAMQLWILFQGFWKRVIVDGFDEGKIDVSIRSLIEGEFCAAAVLISFGALLGKVTWQQMLAITIIECLFFSLNAVLFEYWHIHDIGGAMTIHMFGAYFGLAASFFFEPKKAIQDTENQNEGSYHTQLIATVGSLFLFMYWPSFNAVLATGMSQHRAVVNTFLSISASTLSSVIASSIINKSGKFDMEVLLNATLSGGVVMGAGCDLITQPVYAVLSGFIMGIITTFGFMRGNDFCQRHFRLHDTCGVQFLHGISGTIGAIVTIIAVFCAHKSFPNDFQRRELFEEYPDRSINHQGLMQLAGMAITWAIAIPSGLIAGLVVGKMPKATYLFDDKHSYTHLKYYDDRKNYDDERVDVRIMTSVLV